MTTRGTLPTRIYEQDRQFLLNHRGNGTPADALRNLIINYTKIKEIIQEDLK